MMRLCGTDSFSQKECVQSTELTPTIVMDFFEWRDRLIFNYRIGEVYRYKETRCYLFERARLGWWASTVELDLSLRQTLRR